MFNLVIDAVRRSELPIRLKIAGTGEAEAELRLRAANDPRIEFLGRVSDEELNGLYERCLAVPFVPAREDYGYVTLEAFASGKPVVTCSDSGEPVHFVRQAETGLVCDPDSKSLCRALEYLYAHPAEVERMGLAGAESIASMNWGSVASRLIEAAFSQDRPAENRKKSCVTVLDMQPIDPPVGGGRQRLLGLYHNLAPSVECRYVGSYDWPGESYRRHHLTPGLEEIDVPLSADHHAAARALSEKAGGKTVIDISFGRLGSLSPDYVEAAKDALRGADVVVFSHPWVYRLVCESLSPRQVVIYDSQNVEAFLRAQLLDDSNPVEADLLRDVARDEYEVARRAELVLACSQQDLERFHRIFDLPHEKLRVVPNGGMAFSRATTDTQARTQAKTELGLPEDKLAAIFLGSAYGPNLDAARFIVRELAPSLPDVLFLIVGGVGSALGVSGSNVRIAGVLDEESKHRWLSAADLALNPMFAGSGTNIKMFDFMAHRLPTVTTAVGARGIEQAGRTAMLIVELTAEAFVREINRLRDPVLRDTVGDAGRICFEESYAWERISELTGAMLAIRQRFAGQPKPAFSVVIPTYERHHQLDALMERLQHQIERDFEVVIVDQSASRWRGTCREFGFPFAYFHAPVKGAVRARNMGAALAQGHVIAFTDDDCLPEPTWLLNARRYFADAQVAGIEGMITSDHLGEDGWRPVTNVGFEGLGFMTANLMLRSGHFQRLGGFDLAFDRPHFREDTDLGWRLQALGFVPYAKDVVVHHPAQKRSIDRESETARAAFFQKDALLYSKHPERYRELFHAERHYRGTPGFAEHLRHGFASNGIEMPDWMALHLFESVQASNPAEFDPRMSH